MASVPGSEALNTVSLGSFDSCYVKLHEACTALTCGCQWMLVLAVCMDSNFVTLFNAADEFDSGTCCSTVMLERVCASFTIVLWKEYTQIALNRLEPVPQLHRHLAFFPE